MVNASFELLKQVQADKAAGRNDTIIKLDKQQEFFQSQKSKYDDIVSQLNSAKNATSLEGIINNLNSAKTKAETAAADNPYAQAAQDLTASCAYQPATCQELIGLYESWPQFFNSQLASINNLLTQTDFDQLKVSVQSVANYANLTLSSLDQQIQSLDSLQDELGGFNPNDWTEILNAITPNQIQMEEILKKVFSVFSKQYYYTPPGTTYRSCIKGVYVGDPNEPVYFYSDVSIVQPYLGVLTQSTCTAIDSVTISP